MNKFELLKTSFINLFFNNKSTKDISKELNISTTTVYNWKKKLNLNEVIKKIDKNIIWSGDSNFKQVVTPSNRFLDKQTNILYCYRKII